MSKKLSLLHLSSDIRDLPSVSNSSSNLKLGLQSVESLIELVVKQKKPLLFFLPFTFLYLSLFPVSRSFLVSLLDTKFPLLLFLFPNRRAIRLTFTARLSRLEPISLGLPIGLSKLVAGPVVLVPVDV